jgi:DNA (cytosine-5)-methyltransferase 1
VCALENVRGLVQCGVLPVIVEAFIAHGFDPVYTLLNAADYGVPQNRVRLFVVGFRDPVARAAFRWPTPTHGAPGNLLRLPPWRTVREALGLSPGEYRAGRIEGATGWNGQRMLDVDAPSPTVTSRTNPKLLSRLDRPSPTIGAGGTDTGGAKPLANARTRRELLAELAAARSLDRPSPTVTATEQKSARNFGSRGAQTASRRAGDKLNPALARQGVDRLTPRDCARLQSFPDDFEFVGDTGEQFRQAGNAVPPLLGEAVGRSIAAALRAAATVAA